MDHADRAFVRSKATPSTVSTFLNLRRIAEHPYAIHHKEKPLAGRTVYVVGAGPSLAVNGHHLIDAQDKGAAIFAVNASACGVEGKDGILPSLGVTPDVMFARESLDLSDQIERCDARMIVLDIAINPLTWAACADRPMAWYFPLYPRHGIWYRRLGLRPLGTGTAAFTAAVAFALQWGAAEVVLVGADLAFGPDGTVYHGEAPRGDERADAIAPDAVRFSRREQDAARCERSGQVVGPDELGVTRCISHDFAGYVQTLHTWEAQRTWFQLTAARHPEVQFTNATEGGGGIVGWAQERLADVVERHPTEEPMELPRGTGIDPSVAEQIVEDLQREASVWDNLCREMTDPHGPDIKHLPLSGLETREGHRPRFGFLEHPLLVPVLAAEPLLAEDMFDIPAKTITRLRRYYEINREAARKAGELSV